MICPNCLRPMVENRQVPGLFRCRNPYCIHYTEVWQKPEQPAEQPETTDESA